MEITTRNNQLLIDAKVVQTFTYELRGAIEVAGTVIVLLESKHINFKSSADDVLDANRNMFGLTTDGNIKWRTESQCVPSKDGSTDLNPFMYVTSYGDNKVVVHTWGEDIYKLNLGDGNLSQLYGSELIQYLKDAKQKGIPILTIPSDDSSGPSPQGHNA